MSDRLQYLSFIALVLLLSACLPVTVVRFDIEGSRNPDELDRIETMIEKMGFKRVLVEQQGQKAGRLERENEVVSLFESYPTAGLGITVYWSKNTETVKVTFVERGRHELSNQGRVVMQQLESGLREFYGNAVQLDSDSLNVPFF